MRMDAMQHEDFLKHYGILRKSGRYPWGTGKNPLQRSKTFRDIINQHEKVDGMTEAQIAKAYSNKEHKLSVADIRAMKTISGREIKLDQIHTAQKLKDKGMGASDIGRQMGLSESTVRSLLEPGRAEKADILQNTADMLKRQVEEKGFIDVGANVEMDLPIGTNPEIGIGISADKFNTAISMLKEEGYQVHPLMVRQQGTGDFTRRKVLVAPGVTKQDVFANRDNIRLISEKTDDRGRTYTDFGIQPPLAVDPARVGVRYKEDGGADADGVIYVRPGVPDLSMGKSTYAQVRIQVGDGHYLKGMAVYKDDLPAGVDLMFNTNKSNTGKKLDALKELKRDDAGNVDKDNPFGAVIKEGGQLLGKDGKVSSALNKVNEEGDWDNWSRNISSQVLSKQSPDLAKNQLDMTYERRRAEFEKISQLTNPQVKRKLLDSFADEADAAAVHLKAAAMPKQATRVLLPSNSVKPTEIFAPSFKDGERVALVRYPHAGTFEIPELTVNNRTREARNLLQIGKGGKATDVVVINPKVAERLSGADFDGDAVVVIPNNRKQIKSTPALDQLKSFDPQSYKVPTPKDDPVNGRITISPTRKQNEMGNVTNLISDMTIKGANFDEISRAVRHSMVVIDSEKHNLDFKRSEQEHGIRDLKRKYQFNEKTGQPGGASTLITRAASDTRVLKRKARSAAEGGPIDPKTGRKVLVPTGEHNVKFPSPDGRKKPNGKPVTITKSFRSKEEAEEFVRTKQPKGTVAPRMEKSERLAETDDAYTLVSGGRGTRMEQVYADHSNRLKALANEARREQVRVRNIPYEPSAAKVYAHEVKSLESKLRLAEKNAPLERQAQTVAGRIVSQRKAANPNMEPDELRKIKGQALTEARMRTGAKKTRLGSTTSPITDREWEAIQAGAISNYKLERILRNADLDVIRERATPRLRPVMTDTATRRAKQMLSNGYTIEEVSDALGIAQSTINSGLATEGGG